MAFVRVRPAKFGSGQVLKSGFAAMQRDGICRFVTADLKSLGFTNSAVVSTDPDSFRIMLAVPGPDDVEWAVRICMAGRRAARATVSLRCALRALGIDGDDAIARCHGTYELMCKGSALFLDLSSATEEDRTKAKVAKLPRDKKEHPWRGPGSPTLSTVAEPEGGDDDIDDD